MRNPPRTPRPSRLAAVLLAGVALTVADGTAPAAHAVPRVASPRLDGSVIIRPRVAPARLRRRPFRAPRGRALSAAGRPWKYARPATPSAPATGDAWARLRACESGGRYDINTGNGFSGAYQFLPATWRSLGFPGLPHQATPEMQDAAARALQARSGWGQWPACARRLGLR